MCEILLAFGANLGDRKRQIETAWGKIGNLPETSLLRLSTLYETEPVGGPKNQEFFQNSAGLIRTTIEPVSLLRFLHEIESQLGRIRAEHWGPRTIDIDLIFYGQSIINTESLIIPHPRMHLRGFVLDPAAEIAPNFLHPALGKTVAELKEIFHRNLR